MAKLFANSGNPDQTPHSDLDMQQCLWFTLLGVSRLKRVKKNIHGRHLQSDEEVKAAVEEYVPQRDHAHPILGR